MRKCCLILVLLLLMLPSCSTIPFKKNPSPETALLEVRPQQKWNYPGKFTPQSGEYLAIFFLNHNTLSPCQLQLISPLIVENLHHFQQHQESVVEEKLNFLQIKLSPGEDWFLVKSSQSLLAQGQCLELQRYLIHSFNFSLKE